MATLFVSHATVDKPLAKRLVNDLRAVGHDIWIDSDIPVGDSIPVALSRGLSGADFVLLLMTPSSMRSLWVQGEWATTLFAQMRDGKRRLLPILAESCEIPPFLQELKYADFRNSYSEGWATLMHALRERLAMLNSDSQSAAGSATADCDSVTDDAVDQDNDHSSFDNLLNDLVNTARTHPLQLLLLGRTGVGKSSMINSLFGRALAPVNDYKPETTAPRFYEDTIGGVLVRIMDTPGLCDELPEAGNDDRYLAALAALKIRFDCVLFTTPLSDRRVTNDEKRAIKIISDTLGPKIWDHSIIVLTCGDMVAAGTLQVAKSNRTALVQQEILKHSSSAAASAIPSVITTSTSKHLPDGTEWLPVLFTTVLSRLSARAGKSFLVSAAPRLRPASGRTEDKNSTDISLTPEQVRVVEEKLDDWYPGYTAGGAVAGTILFGPVGTVIGAAVGGVIDGIRWWLR